MKIAYLARVSASSLGVYNKICDQAAAWQTHGHDASLFLVSDTAPPGNPDFLLWPRYNLCNPRLPLLRRLAAFDPDLIYFREEGVSLFIPLLLARFRKRTVIEINGSTRKEGALSSGSFSDWRAKKLNIFTQPLVMRSVTGIVPVSHELAGFPEFACQPHQVVIPNSVNLRRHPLLKSAEDTGPVRLIFLGSPEQAWHGVDKIPQLAQALGKEFEFHIVGPTSDDVFPEGDGAHRANVFVHGYLPPEDFLPVLKKCHIGLGTLALYRIQSDEASPLKVRDYIAAGLPVILPYADTAFMDTCPDWVLSLPNEPTALEQPEVIERFRAFCLANRQRVVTHAESAPYIDSLVLEGNKMERLAVLLCNDKE